VSVVQLSEARLLTAKQFAKLSRELEERARARSEAEIMLAKAKEQADAIIAQAEKKAEEQERRLAEMSDEALQRFLNEDAIDISARALGNLLEHSKQIRKDLDQAQTWILPVLRTAFKRIIGNLPEDDVLAGSIAQSLNEVRDRWDLVLRCHPTLQKQLAQIVEEDSRLSAAIREVQVDRALTVDECRLVSGQGILDIGVNTQIETFLRAIEQFLEEENEQGHV